MKKYFVLFGVHCHYFLFSTVRDLERKGQRMCFMFKFNFVKVLTYRYIDSTAYVKIITQNETKIFNDYYYFLLITLSIIISRWILIDNKNICIYIFISNKIHAYSLLLV